MATKINFPPNSVGLIVRGKTSDSHSPGLMEQHADCILPDGGPVGYFGDEGDGSSGRTSSGGGSSSVSWNRSGMNMKGFVAYYPEFQRIRPFYVNIDQAMKYGVQSTVLVIQITPEQAKIFTQTWKNMALSPGTFNILGGNCSTHASSAFVEAKILSQGIPGLDTPNNLYQQLKDKKKPAFKSYSGYVGFKPSGFGGYDIYVEAAKKSF